MLNLILKIRRLKERRAGHRIRVRAQDKWSKTVIQWYKKAESGSRKRR